MLFCSLAVKYYARNLTQKEPFLRTIIPLARK